MILTGLTDRRWHTMSKLSRPSHFGSVAVGTFVCTIFTAYIVHQVHVDAHTLHQCTLCSSASSLQ
jgi:hypothetical protein